MTQSTPGQPASGTDAQVTEYIVAVRTHLADLAPDDLDDLTAGMSADLSEMLRERGGTLTDHLGSPATYAEELRSAAGLPSRSGPRRTRSLRERMRDTWDQSRRDNPVVAATAAYVVTLRPAWWLLRGLAAAFVLLAVFGGSWRELGTVGGALFAMAVMAVSVWVGLRTADRSAQGLRRRWAAALNAALGLAALSCVVTIWSSIDRPVDYVTEFDSLADDTVATSNLYVYDSAGRRVDGARILTAEGAPLQVSQPLGTGGYAGEGQSPGDPVDRADGAQDVVRTDMYGATVRHVYPRRLVGIDPWKGPWAELGGWTPPRVYPPLAPLSSSPAPRATPSEPPVPPASARPSASATATPPTPTIRASSSASPAATVPATRTTAGRPAAADGTSATP